MARRASIAVYVLAIWRYLINCKWLELKFNVLSVFQALLSSVDRIIMKNQDFKLDSVEVVRFIGVFSYRLLLLVQNLHLVAYQVLYLLLQDPVHHVCGFIWPFCLLQTYGTLADHTRMVPSYFGSYFGQGTLFLFGLGFLDEDQLLEFQLPFLLQFLLELYSLFFLLLR